MRYIKIFVAGFLLFSCSSPDAKKDASGHADSLDTGTLSSKAESPAGQNYLMQQGDSLELPEFDIKIELSSLAEEKLKQSRESVIVMAFFSGTPVDRIPDKFKDKVDTDGLLWLCSRSVELTDHRTAKFRGIKFHKDLYSLLADKDIELTINVYSGRRSGPDNILSCDFLHEKMSKIAGKTFTLKGKLIEES